MYMPFSFTRVSHGITLFNQQLNGSNKKKKILFEARFKLFVEKLIAL